MFEKNVYSAALANILCVIGVCASFYPSDCFTWKNNENGHLVLSCKLSGARANVNIYDSKKRYMVKCPNEKEKIKCKANSNENNETTFTVTVEQNYEGQWFCENKDITLNANISVSKGFLFSTQLNISGEIVGDNRYRLSCSTCWEVQGASVEFLVNSISNDSVRLEDNECYHQRRKCVDRKCSCSSNSFSWTFVANNKSLIHNFSCKADFFDKIRNCGKRQIIPLIVDGQDFKTDLPSVSPIGDCKQILIPDKNNNDCSEFMTVNHENGTNNVTQHSQNNNQLGYKIATIVLGVNVLLFAIIIAAIYQKFKTVNHQNGTNNESIPLESVPNS